MDKVFVVGLGSGTTTGALLRNPVVKQATVAELEPAIFEAQRYFQAVNGDPLRQSFRSSGRILPLQADGRNVLAMAGDASLDLIVSQPAEPWISGSCDLYSAEFWRMARTKLKKEGIFCQWIQLYAIDTRNLAVLLRTFLSAFPNASLMHTSGAGEVILVAFNDQNQRFDAAAVAQRLHAGGDRSERSYVDWKSTGFDIGDALKTCTVIDAQGLARFCRLQAESTGDDRLNTDDNMLAEFALPPALRTAGDTTRANLSALIQSANKLR